MRKIFFAWGMTLASAAFISSCNTSSTTEHPATAQEATAPADSTAAQTAQMAYICPMKCEGSAGMQPGKCPVCGMDLEKNSDFHASTDSTANQ